MAPTAAYVFVTQFSKEKYLVFNAFFPSDFGDVFREMASRLWTRISRINVGNYKIKFYELFIALREKNEA